MNEQSPIGRSVRRREDARFLTGQGRYLADVDAAGCLHGHVLRSPYGHAVVRSIALAEAAALPGVHGIFTHADLAADGLGPLPCLAGVESTIVPPRPALANGRVRHIGDPVAFIVADSEEIAREAAEAIVVDYDPLPAVVDGMAALSAGAPQIWDQAPGNLVFRIERGDGAAVAKVM